MLTNTEAVTPPVGGSMRRWQRVEVRKIKGSTRICGVSWAFW